jgi:uncharacterized protein YndB with AHSA1/START domain
MRVEETFVVARPPEIVFDYVTNPANLSSWQTSSSVVEQLTDGPAGPGARFHERVKPPVGKEFEQVTEFAEFDRPRRLHVHVIEGPYPVDGTWLFEPDGTGTRVHFIAEGEAKGLMKVLGPIAARLLARRFAAYHRNLRRNVEQSH